MTSDANVDSGSAAHEGPSPPVRYRPEFHADPREYFRIWIVNLALTILTLGIYSAWAKVRKLRYFYGSTVLAGSAFGYHGDPRKILKGRLIAALLALCYVGAGRISPLATLAVAALLAVATPWLVVRSRMFALRVTSWRGLRFDFRPDYRGAYATLLGKLVLVGLTAGIMAPWFLKERYRFIITRSRFADTDFECNPRTGRFYKTALAAVGLTFGAVVVAALVGGMLMAIVFAAHGKPSSQVSGVIGLVVAALIYAIILPVGLGYTQARNLSEVFSHTTLGPHRFECRLRARPLIGIYLTNLLAMIVTLGLYTPWAQIRLARYRLEAMELEAHGSLDEFVASAPAPVPAAVGEEISSLLDVDFGF
jgi:uncharacterized membrane protein YjgN (DUF898 family)